MYLIKGERQLDPGKAVDVQLLEVQIVTYLRQGKKYYRSTFSHRNPNMERRARNVQLTWEWTSACQGEREFDQQRGLVTSMPATIHQL